MGNFTPSLQGFVSGDIAYLLRASHVMVPLAKKVMNGDAEVIRLMALITLYLAEYIDTSMMKVEWIASKCIEKTLKSQKARSENQCIISTISTLGLTTLTYQTASVT